MKSKCGKKLTEINKAVQVLQTELITASRAYNFTSDEEPGSSGVAVKIPKTKTLSNGHSSKHSTPVVKNTNGAEEFIGFSDDDPLRESIRSKSLQLALETSDSDKSKKSNGHTSTTTRRGSRIKTPTYKSAVAASNNEKLKKPEPRGKEVLELVITVN